MKLWSLVRLFGDHSATGIFLIAFGMICKKFGVLSGPLIRNLCYLTLNLILPLFNFALFLKADLFEFAEIGLILVPLWIFKLGYTYAWAYLCTRLITMPPDFHKPFIALLMADSVNSHMSFLRDELCTDGSFDLGDNERTFGVTLPCDEISKRATFYISFLNALVALTVGPYFIKSGILYHQTYGKSMVWIDQELYFTKFEVEIEKDEENYDLLIENRRENKSFLYGHLTKVPFLSLFAGLGMNSLLYMIKPSDTFANSIQFVLSGLSSIQQPLIWIMLGSVIAKLSLNFKRGLMVNSRIALIHAFLKLVVVPSTIFLTGLPIFRLALSGNNFDKIVTQYFLSSLWSPSSYLLLFAIEHQFAYREIAYIIYYDTMLGLLSMPLMTWLFVY